MELRADGLDIAEIAAELGVSYRAAEGALGRARGRLRKAWAATAALLSPLLLWRPRRLAAVASPAAVAVALVTAIAVGPHGQPPAAGPQPRAAQPAGQRAAEPPRAVPPTAATAVPAPPTARPAAPDDPPPAPAPRAAPSAAPAARPVATTAPVNVGPAKVGRAAVEQTRPDEPLVDSVRRCLKDGISTDPQALICRG